MGCGGAGWGGVGRGRAGVNAHGGLFLPLCWGRGPGAHAGLWGTSLGAGNRSHVKSYCCAFCRVRVGMEPAERRPEGARVLAWGEGWPLRTQRSLGPSRLASPVLRSRVEGAPRILTVCVCTSTQCALHAGRCTRVPCRKDSKSAAPPAAPGSPARLVWSGLCPP